MSETFDKISPLVVAGDVIVSAHGARRLVEHSIEADDIVCLCNAEVMEDYPTPSTTIWSDDA